MIDQKFCLCWWQYMSGAIFLLGTIQKGLSFELFLNVKIAIPI